MRGKEANPTRTCADCFHCQACHMWSNGANSATVAAKCPRFETVRCATLKELQDLYKMHKGEVAPVRHGEWVDEINPNAVTASGREVHVWRCSSCGFTWANKHDVLHYFKHCPNCGAKMDGRKENV